MWAKSFSGMITISFLRPLMNTLVVLPTYNEKENILRLLQELMELPVAVDALIIDDNSPDGTAGSVEERYRDDPRIQIIRREKKLGLGTAYSTGFRHALFRGYERVITMDADFSHQPRFIPDFLKVSEDFDFLIGSRYVPGGDTLNWSAARKFISRTANFMAHHILGLKPRDCTSGFRLYHKATLNILEFETIRADGYSYLVEILYRASMQGLRIGEVPIVFVEREQGTSKISRKEIWKALGTIVRLRRNPQWEKKEVPVKA
jgi:dolichol-phosphate mannosyltransferase